MLKFHPLALRARAVNADDAVMLTLAVPESLGAEFRAEPGQHVVLRAAPAGLELRRTYSVLPAPAGELRLAVRVQGELSRFLASGLAVGDVIDVMPPNGRYHRAAAAGAGVTKRYLALAAGSGITPVLAVVAAVLEREPGASVVLLYGNRSIGRAMCLEDVLALKNRFLDRLVLHFVMSREPQEVDLFNGRIDVARLQALTPQLLRPAEFDEAFACLPGRSAEEIAGWLKAQGMDGRVHVEHFTIDTTGAAANAPPAAAATPAIAPAASGGAEITVILDGRRRSFTMAFDGDSVLDAAAAAGIDLPFSCKDGICSTCRTRVVEGSVEMAQNYALEDWEVEAGFVLCCQARPKTPRVAISYDEK